MMKTEAGKQDTDDQDKQRWLNQAKMIFDYLQ